MNLINTAIKKSQATKSNYKNFLMYYTTDVLVELTDLRELELTDFQLALTDVIESNYKLLNRQNLTNDQIVSISHKLVTLCNKMLENEKRIKLQWQDLDVESLSKIKASHYQNQIKREDAIIKEILNLKNTFAKLEQQVQSVANEAIVAE